MIQLALIMTSMSKEIRVASRTSQLAQAMTNQVIGLLNNHEPQYTFVITGIKTNNSTDVNAHLGIKGIFTNALDESVRSGTSTFAVHSAKDLPSALSHDMVIAAYLKRDSVNDVLISKHGVSFENLPKNAVIGTASIRRSMLVTHFRPDISMKPLRGNIDTRLSKKADYDAIILAGCGLQRLDLSNHITEVLNPHTFIPAAGQGTIAITCKKNDTPTITLLSQLDDQDTRDCVEIERKICSNLNLSCHAPIGIYAYFKDNIIHLDIHLERNKHTYVDSFEMKKIETIDGFIERATSTIMQKTS